MTVKFYREGEHNETLEIKDNLLGVRISKDKDNLLSVKNDGLFVQDSPKQVMYFVANEGSDETGDGTAANPYATVDYAINQLLKTTSKRIAICVKSGQRHRVSDKPIRFEGTSFYIYAYMPKGNGFTFSTTDLRVAIDKDINTSPVLYLDNPSGRSVQKFLITNASNMGTYNITLEIGGTTGAKASWFKPIYGNLELYRTILKVLDNNTGSGIYIDASLAGTAARMSIKELGVLNETSNKQPVPILDVTTGSCYYVVESDGGKFKIPNIIHGTEMLAKNSGYVRGVLYHPSYPDLPINVMSNIPM